MEEKAIEGVKKYFIAEKDGEKHFYLNKLHYFQSFIYEIRYLITDVSKKAIIYDETVGSLIEDFNIVLETDDRLVLFNEMCKVGKGAISKYDESTYDNSIELGSFSKKVIRESYVSLENFSINKDFCVCYKDIEMSFEEDGSLYLNGILIDNRVGSLKAMKISELHQRMEQVKLFLMRDEVKAMVKNI